MKVVIRADASIQIGTGHVMRCLTLAGVLKNQGAEVSFICREHKGNLIHYIEEKGYFVSRLDNPFSNTGIPNKLDNSSLVHAGWLGSTQKEDAKACDSILETIIPDWLIVDHYAIDYRWQIKLKKHYKSLMVIDDLADRKHECNLLLDQTFGRKEDDYNNLIPKDCIFLSGAQYALLRPEFLEWRKYSLQRRTTPELKNILINMGGIDQDNVTGQVLHILKTCVLPEILTVTVIIGAASPNIESVKKLAMAMPIKTEVKVSVNNIAELMANADLAIGAAGSTTWERCCLGLPSIQIVIADNQKIIAKNLTKMNVIQCVENLADLPSLLNEIVKRLRKFSVLSSSITDGSGGDNVYNYLISNTSTNEKITLKPVELDDCEYIYSLQTTDARKYSINPVKPIWKEHLNWFKKTMNDDFSILFIIMLGKKFAGMLRLDNIDDKEIEISIIISPDYSGQGIAKKSLKQAIKLQPKARFKAAIHKENIPSQHVFEKTGFNKVGELDDFLRYTLVNS